MARDLRQDPAQMPDLVEGPQVSAMLSRNVAKARGVGKSLPVALLPPKLPLEGNGWLEAVFEVR